MSWLRPEWLDSGPLVPYREGDGEECTLEPDNSPSFHPPCGTTVFLLATFSFGFDQSKTEMTTPYLFWEAICDESESPTLKPITSLISHHTLNQKGWILVLICLLFLSRVKTGKVWLSLQAEERKATSMSLPHNLQEYGTETAWLDMRSLARTMAGTKAFQNVWKVQRDC